MERPKRTGVMLAYPMDEGKLKRLGQSAIVQPKLNGERCRVEWFRDEPILLSSYANIFPHLQQIKNALSDIYLQTGIHFNFDGELYVHGWDFSRIHSAVSTSNTISPDNPSIQFHIFDIQGKAEQDVRICDLISILDDVGQEHKDIIVPVPTHYLDTKDWEVAANHYVDQGYEGIILRKRDNHYEAKRTVNMLKFKPTEQDTYKIIEVLEAISKEGEPKQMVGAFRVADSDGNTFKVGAGKMKHPIRESLWINRETITGRLLSVKHEKLRTSGGVPVCAVAVEVL